MNSLSVDQRRFARMIVQLINYIHAQGYEVTFGDAFRDPRLHGALGVKLGYGHPRSAHKQRLALDLNLFKDGKFLTMTSDHEPFGVFWESLGGAWGGRFSTPDGNHYSIERDGVK
jgi:hypothetical protein